MKVAILTYGTRGDVQPTGSLMPEPPDWPAQVRNIGAVDVPAELRGAWGEGHVGSELAAWIDAGGGPTCRTTPLMMYSLLNRSTTAGCY